MNMGFDSKPNSVTVFEDGAVTTSSSCPETLDMGPGSRQQHFFAHGQCFTYVELIPVSTHHNRRVWYTLLLQPTMSIIIMRTKIHLDSDSITHYATTDSLSSTDALIGCFYAARKTQYVRVVTGHGDNGRRGHEPSSHTSSAGPASALGRPDERLIMAYEDISFHPWHPTASLRSIVEKQVDFLPGFVSHEEDSRPKPFCDALIAHIVIHVAGVLRDLHRSGLAHGGLCPSKILLTPDLSVYVTPRDTTESEWSDGVRWLSPQTANVSSHNNDAELHVTQAADVWALGLIAYYLCTCRAPFAGESTRTAVVSQLILFSKMSGVLPPERRCPSVFDPASLSSALCEIGSLDMVTNPLLRDLIEGCVRTDLGSRWSIDTVLQSGIADEYEANWKHLFTPTFSERYMEELGVFPSEALPDERQARITAVLSDRFTAPTLDLLSGSILCKNAFLQTTLQNFSQIIDHKSGIPNSLEGEIDAESLRPHYLCPPGLKLLLDDPVELCVPLYASKVYSAPCDAALKARSIDALTVTATMHPEISRGPQMHNTYQLCAANPPHQSTVKLSKPMPSNRTIVTFSQAKQLQVNRDLDRISEYLRFDHAEDNENIIESGAVRRNHTDDCTSSSYVMHIHPAYRSTITLDVDRYYMFSWLTHKRFIICTSVLVFFLCVFVFLLVGILFSRNASSRRHKPFRPPHQR